MSAEDQKFWLVEREAKMKCERLYKQGSLSGHITGWRRLCRAWKSSETTRREFQALGFDFSQEHFAKDNGAEGKIPVLPSEFKKIGLDTVFQTIDYHSENMLEFRSYDYNVFFIINTAQIRGV